MYVGKTRSVKTAFKVSEHILLTKKLKYITLWIFWGAKMMSFSHQKNFQSFSPQFWSEKSPRIGQHHRLHPLVLFAAVAPHVWQCQSFSSSLSLWWSFFWWRKALAVSSFPANSSRMGPTISSSSNIMSSKAVKPSLNLWTAIARLVSTVLMLLHRSFGQMRHMREWKLTWVLSLPLKASAQELWVAQSLVHRLESRWDYWGMRVIRVEERHQRVLSDRSTMTHDPRGTLCGCASHWCLLCAKNWPTQHLAWLSDPPPPPPPPPRCPWWPSHCSWWAH